MVRGNELDVGLSNGGLTMKKLLLSSVALIGFASVAVAADLPARTVPIDDGKRFPPPGG